uniref:C2H2-type domain-containing protein n=1 Tax=Meloidogyne javanica TaxID=6303 RepID=A0A915MAG5_MELJA
MHRHRGTHSGIKPFECRFCQKKFFRKDQMQEHSMTHIKTGNDFDCPVSGCSFKFSQHNLLKQHLDQKHAISPSLQGQCKLCNLQFSNARRLLMHYQTKHEEYASNDSPVLEVN